MTVVKEGQNEGRGFVARLCSVLDQTEGCESTFYIKQSLRRVRSEQRDQTLAERALDSFTASAPVCMSAV